ncbi:benzoate/H(+) symporter BenE family transporter [Myceligenerans crystallogenes]|uniref:Benzoate/H(+) symporter BenE family transporter n=1 Tax=Myceligenerans crystallogenes TaxID=316335 RepID=A0ABN2NMZ2_9MICO
MTNRPAPGVAPAAPATGEPGAGTRGGPWWGDLSVSAAVAGFIAVVVSYSGPMVIILAAAEAGRLSAGQTASWVWAVSIGSGLTCLGLSLWTRQPVITAWSTPGAALLVSSLDQFTFGEAVAAYLLSALAITVVGLTGIFGKLMATIPAPLVSAMLAGILFSFGVGLFDAVAATPLVPLVVFAAYLAVKRFSARYAVLCALVAGVVAVAATGGFDMAGVRLEIARPEWTAPEFGWAALVGIGIPMFVVTMASQNATGLGVLQTSGYTPDDRKLVGVTGLVSVLLAPFGSHAINLAAITAAICTGPEAHTDPRKRWPAGVFCGLFYLLIGTFGATLVALFTGLPGELVAAIAGVALLGALMGGLKGAMDDAAHREAALVTLLVTASGLTLFGIGSAFWGLILGILTHVVLTVRRRGAPG